MSDRSWDYLDGRRDGMTYRAEHIEKLEVELEHARECFRSCDEQAQRFRAEIERLAAREVALTELVDGAIKVMTHHGLDVLAEAYRRALEGKT